MAHFGSAVCCGALPLSAQELTFYYLGRGGRAVFSNRVQALVGGDPEHTFISYEKFADIDRRMKQLETSMTGLTEACVPLSEKDFDDETIKSMTDVLMRNVISLDSTK